MQKQLEEVKTLSAEVSEQEALLQRKTLEEEHAAGIEEKNKIIEELQKKLNAKDDEIKSLEDG